LDLGLDGKRAIVTGGSRGIGRSTVETLAAEGCSVAFCARGPEGVDEAASELRSRGARVVGAAVDVGDAGAYREWLADAVSELGGLDILVCNATGYARPGEEGWRGAFEIDLLGVVRAIEVVLPALTASGAGSIVAMSSSIALDVFLPGGEAYSAMKSAMINYSKALARAHGAKGSGATPSRRRQSSSKATSGAAGVTSSSRSTRRCDPEARSGGWDRPKRSLEPSSSWRAPRPAGSPAPTWSSTAVSAVGWISEDQRHDQQFCRRDRRHAPLSALPEARDHVPSGAARRARLTARGGGILRQRPVKSFDAR
jgi:NAD(P)-dependent dehydrogenase (short-subunit alcohol dehydrogenase family)